MFRLLLFRIVPFFLLLLAPAIHSQTSGNSDRVQLKLNTDEAEAVLSILDQRAAGTPLTDADWQKLFNTEPYSIEKARGRYAPRLQR